LIRIVTQFDKDAVLAALRELAPDEPGAPESTFEGQIDLQRLVIGYRFNAPFNAPIPSIRLVTFSGRVTETDAGTRIHGNISSGWVIYALVAWLVAVTALGALPRYVADGNYFTDLWVLAIPVGLFLLGRAFVRSTQDHVVAEIGRAVRGKVTHY
jgi:hypothetical protein